MILEDLAIELAGSAIYDFGKAVKDAVAKNETVRTVLKRLCVSHNLHDFPDRYVEALVALRF